MGKCGNGDIGDVDDALLLALSRGKLPRHDNLPKDGEHSLDESTESSSTVSSEDNQQDHAVVKPRMVLRRRNSFSNLMNDEDSEGDDGDKIKQPTITKMMKKHRRRNSFNHLMPSSINADDSDGTNKYGFEDVHRDVHASSSNRPSRRTIRRRNSFSNLMESAVKSALKKTSIKKKKNSADDYFMGVIDNHADIWDDNNNFDSFSDMQASQRELEDILAGSSIPNLNQGLISTSTTTASTNQLNCVDASALPASNCASSDDDDGDDDDDSIDIYIEGDDEEEDVGKVEKGEANKKSKKIKKKSKKETKEKKPKKSKKTTEKTNAKKKSKEDGDTKKRMKVAGSASDNNLMEGISVEDLIDRKEKRKKKNKSKKNRETMNGLKKSSSESNLFGTTREDDDNNGAVEPKRETRKKKKTIQSKQEVECDFQQRAYSSDSKLLWNATDDDDDDSIKAITSKRKAANSCSNSTTMLSKANRKKKTQRRKIKYQSPRDIYGMSKTVQPKQPLPEFLLMSPKVDAFAFKDRKGQAFNALFNDDAGMLEEGVSADVAAVLNEVRDDYDDSSDEDEENDNVPTASISHVTKRKVVVSVIRKSSSTTSLVPYDIVCNERDSFANERDSLQHQLNEELLVNESLREEIQLLRDELNKSKRKTIQEKDKDFLDRSTATLVAKHRHDSNDDNTDKIIELTQQVQLLQKQLEEQKNNNGWGSEVETEVAASETTDARYQLGRLNGEVLQLKAKLNDRDETVASLKKKVNELITIKPLLKEKAEEDQEVLGQGTKEVSHVVDTTITPSTEEDWKTRFICMQRQNEQLTSQMKHHAKEHETKMKDKEETINFLQEQLVKAMTDGGQPGLVSSSTTSTTMGKPRMKRRNSFTNLFMMGED